MTGTHKTNLVFHRKSKRISIRNPVNVTEWVTIRKNVSSQKVDEHEFYNLLNDYMQSAKTQLDLICPYVVEVGIMTYLWDNYLEWLDENATDRWCLDDSQLVRFKSKKDAAYFKLVWG